MKCDHCSQTMDDGCGVSCVPPWPTDGKPSPDPTPDVEAALRFLAESSGPICSPRAQKELARLRAALAAKDEQARNLIVLTQVSERVARTEREAREKAEAVLAAERAGFEHFIGVPTGPMCPRLGRCNAGDGLSVTAIRATCVRCIREHHIAAAREAVERKEGA
jgi:hypothetical protein